MGAVDGAASDGGVSGVVVVLKTKLARPSRRPTPADVQLPFTNKFTLSSAVRGTGADRAM